MPDQNTNRTQPCDACRVRGERLFHAGSDLKKWDFVVALAGNPNTGKSTIFNALTGLRQHTGNWPGKTVTRAEGGFRYEGKPYKLVDLPGTYSLLSASVDEEIARDFILFGRPDCTIVTVDATCLERNLNLVLQVLEITDKVIIALNLVDEARRKGIEIDHKQLSRDLGVAVIPTVGRTKEGLPDLLAAISQIVHGRMKTTPYRIKHTQPLQNCLDEISGMIRKVYPGLPNVDWVAMRILEGDPRMREALLDGSIAVLKDTGNTA